MSLVLTQLASLPVYGEPAQTFSNTGMQLHTAGLVVKFEVPSHSIWIGNFIPGLTDFDFVQIHPNGANAFVVSGGNAYVVDPITRTLKATFGGAIVEVFSFPPNTNSLVINHQNIAFEAIGPDGVLWLSRRISWDGFRKIEISANNLTGEAWDPSDNWVPFALDLNTGSVVGGSFPIELSK